MTRQVQCGPETLQPIVDSEVARGNSGGRWQVQPPSEPSYHFTYPLDLDAIRAEFDLPDCLQVWEWPDGRTSLGCTLTRCTVGGGPASQGRRAERARERWWEQQRRNPRPRRVIGG